MEAQNEELDKQLTKIKFAQISEFEKKKHERIVIAKQVEELVERIQEIKLRIAKTKKEARDHTDIIRGDLSIIIKRRDVVAMNMSLTQEEINACFFSEVPEEDKSPERLLAKKMTLKSKKTKIIKKDSHSSSKSSDS